MGRTPLPRSVDVAVVGAGTAGAATAALSARRGLSVVCIDRRPLARAGARWVNGVPEWSFHDAGIPPPVGAERLGNDVPFHLVAGSQRIRIEGHGVFEVDMRLLVERLQQLAWSEGAILQGNTPVGSVRGGALETSRGSVRARWIVDASGLPGAHLLGQPHVPARDVCAAAQQVREVRDLAAARRFLQRHQVEPGETLCFAGIAGGYSILNVRLHEERVSLLTGSIPADGHPPGKEILERFVAEERWIGGVVFGGCRAISLRGPFDRLATDRVALVGDAAGQVFPAHGSGIGAGLVAARMLADALADGVGPPGYARRWKRRFGGTFAAYNLLRRFSQTLTPSELGQLMASGLLDVESVRAALAQVLPRPTPSALVRVALAIPRAPRLAARLAGVVARMLPVLAC